MAAHEVRANATESRPVGLVEVEDVDGTNMTRAKLSRKQKAHRVFLRKMYRFAERKFEETGSNVWDKRSLHAYARYQGTRIDLYREGAKDTLMWLRDGWKKYKKIYRL